MTGEFFSPTQRPKHITAALVSVASLDIRPEEIQTAPPLRFESFTDDGLGEGRDTRVKDQDGRLYVLIYWHVPRQMEIRVEHDLQQAREKVDLLLEWLRIARQYNAMWCAPKV